MPKDDLVYAGHMLDTARDIVQRLKGKQRSDYDSDPNLRLAILHLVQTIGEAARRVSREFQNGHPEIPWSEIIGMRHKVVHDYLTVDFDLVWDVATVELRPLIVQLERIVPPIQR